MESSITTFSGLRCTRVLRTVFFTATSTSGASETAGLPESIGTSTTAIESSITSSATALATTVISSASSTITVGTVLPAVTSSSASPLSTQISSNSLGNSTTDDSKKHATAVAIGASLGAVVFVALIILFAYLRRRKRSLLSPKSLRNGCCCGITGLLPDLKDLISNIKQKLENKVINKVQDKAQTKVQKKVKAIVVGIFHRDSKTKETQNDAETNEKDGSRQAPLQEQSENNRISSPPQRVQPLANPFSDPPNSNTRPNESNSRSENPSNNHTEPAYDSDEISISLPLTVRNVVDSDSEDGYNKKKDTPRHSKTPQTRLSGSTLNLSNGRGSSPLIPDFKTRLENWRRDRKSGDRTSAHSDPFDLERPLTAHSSAQPTPMAEQHKPREGYFH